MVPVHIGIIPDGNRRFGKKYGLDIAQAYEKGIEKLKEVLEWARELGIRILTVWGFSTENTERDPIEKRIFFKLLENKVKDAMKSSELEKHKVRIRFIGRLDFLPKSISEVFNKLEEMTKNYKSYQLNIAIGYGGRQEIVDACNKILSSGIRSVNQEIFEKYLYTNGIPNPELIIRTSGEYRLSGFMPWQSVYAELAFLKPLWPELQKEDFINAIKEFENRERRFGR